MLFNSRFFKSDYFDARYFNINISIDDSIALSHGVVYSILSSAGAFSSLYNSVVSAISNASVRHSELNLAFGQQNTTSFVSIATALAVVDLVSNHTSSDVAGSVTESDLTISYSLPLSIEGSAQALISYSENLAHIIIINTGSEALANIELSLSTELNQSGETMSTVTMAMGQFSDFEHESEAQATTSFSVEAIFDSNIIGGQVANGNISLGIVNRLQAIASALASAGVSLSQIESVEITRNFIKVSFSTPEGRITYTSANRVVTPTVNNNVSVLSSSRITEVSDDRTTNISR